MAVVKFQALMTVTYKVADNMFTFFLGDHLNLLNEGYFQCSNGTRVALVDVVLEEPPEDEIWGCSDLISSPK